jgi:hypothetical protein
LVKKTLLSDKLSENGNIFKIHLSALAVLKVDPMLSSIDDAKNISLFSFLIDDSEKLFLEKLVPNSGDKNDDSILAILLIVVVGLLVLLVTSLIMLVCVTADLFPFSIPKVL